MLVRCIEPVHPGGPAFCCARKPGARDPGARSPGARNPRARNPGAPAPAGRQTPGNALRHPGHPRPPHRRRHPRRPRRPPSPRPGQPPAEGGRPRCLRGAPDRRSVRRRAALRSGQRAPVPDLPAAPPPGPARRDRGHRRGLPARRCARRRGRPPLRAADRPRGRSALAAGNPARAATLPREALVLWRGPALPDLPDAHAERARLGELRLSAVQEKAATGIRLRSYPG
ncbi:BTAD domain-containing putative transcriptional regulator [Streptomyces sp. 3330]|uniref:BTAD domain-containing putative transcriptional regulator n=1 Tax=Streptomyces sp. 3330 TaxID=2817755 RepID=UPI00286CE1DF|nr:BTAD domain-containing putative transcriptional regulator [Streptomyces sp. 3330]